MTSLRHLRQMWLLVKANRAWLEDMQNMNSCSCNADLTAECSYRDAYPDEHNLIQDLLGLLDGRDVPAPSQLGIAGA